MGFFDDITTTYGKEATISLKQLAKINKDLATFKNKKVFLLQCRYYKIYPAHINNNVNVLFHNFEYSHNYLKEINSILNITKKAMLNLEIKITLTKIHCLNTALDKCIHKVNLLLPDNIIRHFKLKQNAFYDKQFNSIKTRQINKVINLVDKHNNFVNMKVDDCFKNLTNEDVPENVKCLLACGPQFAVANNNKDFPLIKLITDIEFCINSQEHIEEQNKNELRAKTTNVITNYIKKSSNINSFNVIDKAYTDTKKYLKENPTVIVTKSDKSKCTVVMYKNDYIQKMNELLSDTNIYKVLTKDPTTKFQNINNKLVKELHDNEMIDDFSYYKLRINNAVAPKIYGLPKTHKPPPIPLRPVVSCINSPAYGIAKFIAHILNNVTAQFSYNVTNSFEFVKFIQDIQLPADYVLISLDVRSLFTNIPKELVVEEIINNWPSIKQHTSISLDMLLKLTEFCFNSSYFVFDGTFFQQLFGTAMGNPASPAFANLVMNKALTEILINLQVKLPFLKLYVDDIITAVPTHSVESVLKCFNDYNVHLQFTVELENNNCLPFLDTLVIRDDSNCIITNWYAKPTTSNRILNFQSCHPIKQKISIIKGTLHRLNNICHPSFIKENIIRFKQNLIRNNYPIGFVKKILNCKQNVGTASGVSQNCTYYKIPYIHKLSDRLVKILQNDNIKIALYNTKKVNNLFSKLKDRVPMEVKSNVIYKLDCMDCNGTYVGQTKQYLKNRIKNHIYDCRVNNNIKEKTALCAHHFDLGHNFNFDLDHVTILDQEINLKKRLFMEMIHISKNNNSVNNRTDIDNLSKVYINLINNTV